MRRFSRLLTLLRYGDAGAAPPPPTPSLLFENGNQVLFENGNAVLLESF